MGFFWVIFNVDVSTYMLVHCCTFFFSEYIQNDFKEYENVDVTLTKQYEITPCFKRVFNRDFAESGVPYTILDGDQKDIYCQM